MDIRHDQLTTITELSSLGLYRGAIEHDGATVVSSLGLRFALVSVESPAPAKPKPSFIERLGNLWCSLYVESMPAPRDYL